jgi:hypothetical protein
MAIVSYDFANTGKSQRVRLAELVAYNADLSDQSFNWLASITNETLEELALRYVQENTGYHAIWPLPADSHLAEASRLLDVCLVQRKEIYQLEAQAVMSALDICLAIGAIEADRKVAKTHFNAALKQLGTTDAAGLTSIDAKFTAQKQGVEERLRLHNQVGGSLNYGERITFLRDMFGKNLRLAYHRMRSVAEGARFAYRVRLPEIDSEAANGDLLGMFVDWVRNASDKLEESDYTEHVYEVLIYLCADGLADSLKTRLSSSNTAGSIRGKFTLKPENLKQDAYATNLQFPEPTDAVRIIGMDLAFICQEDDRGWGEVATELYNTLPQPISGGIGGSASNVDAREIARDRVALTSMINERMREMRRSRTIRMSLTLPWQIVDPGPSQKVLATEPTRFGTVPIWTGGSARDQFRPVATQEVRDRCPFGEWEYDIDPTILSTNGKSQFGVQISPGVGPPHTGWFLGRLQDVVLMLRLAVRRSQFNKP